MNSKVFPYAVLSYDAGPTLPPVLLGPYIYGIKHVLDQHKGFFW